MIDIGAIPLVLLVTTFFAAMLQSATGFGFGMIVGPLLLAFLSGQDAVQATGILTLGIVLLIAPAVFRECNKRVLALLSVGTIVGLPIGSVFHATVPELAIKILAAGIVGAAFVGLVRPAAVSCRDAGRMPDDQRSTLSGIFVGTISGAMSTALAMPGPTAMAYLSGLRLRKESIRATLAVLMVGSYAGMIGFHFIFQGVSETVTAHVLALAPVTILGVIAGNLTASYISVKIFYVLTLLLMGGALISLLMAIVTKTII